MQERTRYSRTIYRDGPPDPLPYLTCAVCGFRGVPADQTPGSSQWGAPPVQVTGSVYVGDRADTPVAELTKTVEVVQQAGTCGFCGAERYLDGSRGSGQRIP